MPTADDYDLAAQTFGSVQDRLPSLLTAVESQVPAIVGGTLARSLRQSVVESQRRTVWCGSQLGDAVELCLARSALIRELEAIERAYNVELDQFETAHAHWLEASNRYLESPLDHPPPGPSPVPPVRPEPPPDWAELKP